MEVFGEMNTIFVGNLPFSASEEEIRELFTKYGEVKSVNLITHHKTGESRGICFIEMSEEDGGKAIKALDGSEYGGRKLHVRFIKDEDVKDTSAL